MDIVITVIVTMIPAAIVAKQPDLGSAIIFLAIGGGVLLMAGLSHRWIVILIVSMVVGALALYPHLKPYQQDRIKVFLNPWEDSLNKGYNVVQSEIAIGSGKVTGKGFGRGSQTRYRFLPEHYTDFIFAGYIEQFGLVGGVMLLSLYAILFFRVLKLALRAVELTGFYLAGGVFVLLVTHVVLNIGMTMGLLPVTGLPLPWMSYGGSSILVSSIAIGLALTTTKEKYMF
jgi:rod shape determining protein RodA